MSRALSLSRRAYPMLMAGTLAVEKGNAVEAEAFAREALGIYLKERNPDAQAEAYDVLAQSYLARSKVPEARDAIEHALAVQGRSFRWRLSLAITAARAYESRSRADSIKQLQTTVVEAVNRGYVGLAFEARLTLGEMQIRAGQGAIGRAQLAALEKEAAGRGFGLIARKARAALTL